jgi:serine O-acetyltransferase
MDIAGRNLTLENIQEYEISDWEKLKYSWYADLYRYTGAGGKKRCLRALFRNPSYRYTFLMRLCSYFSHNKKNLIKKTLFRFIYELFRDCTSGSSVEITYNTRIGRGLYLPHLIGIVINQDSIIGTNCTISQNVTIGDLKRGKHTGSPVIGNNVYIAPGAVIIGSIHIGHNVIIGANSVVNKDLPDNAVAAGIPASVISFQGSSEYINRIDYE